VLGPPSGARVRLLDVGCGSAELFSALDPAGYCFHGVDLSYAMLHEARRRNPQLTERLLAQAAAERLPFPDAHFDVVVSTGVVEYTLDPAETLVEFARVLRPGGILIVSLPHHWSPYALWRSYVFLRLVALVRPSYRLLTGRINPRPPADRFGRRKRYKYSARWPMRHLPTDVYLEDLVFGGFKLLPSPLDSFFPRLDSQLIRAMGGQSRGRLRGLGTYLFVRVRKRGADSSHSPDLRGRQHQ
jgi:SAM-dependent methyltransferase